MSEEKAEFSAEETREKLNDMSRPMKVRKKTVVDVLIDRASASTADVIKNRIVPGVVDLFHDATIGVVDGLFDRGRSSQAIRNRADISRRSSASRKPEKASFSYDNISSRTATRTISDVGRRNHDFSEIIFEHRVEAEDALDRMRLRLEQYDVVSVSDLYSIVGIDDTIQDNKWGWTNLDGSYVRRYRGSFVLDLPPTSHLQ